MSKELTLDEKRALVAELLRKQAELQKLRARAASAPKIQRVSRDEPLSLSFVQEQFLFLQQVAPKSANYNMSLALKLSGQLDAGALERAFEQVIRRHEVLRTGFAVVDGQPIQVIGSPSFHLLVVDLERLASEEKEAALDRYRRERATEPFDLERAPLFRGTLVRMGPDEHVLLLTVHHVVFDAVSFAPLLTELSEIYNASREQRPPRLPDLTTQFADYAAWQRSTLVGESLEKVLAYWKKQFRGVPTLEMPTDRPHPATASHECKRERIVVANEVLEGLKLLGQRAGVTPLAVMLAAFEVLLHRYSGQERFAIGFPIMHRPLPEVEGAIGCFAHPLALAADLSGDPTFVHLLKRVHDATLGAYAHQDLPLGKLVAEIAPERRIDRNPIFQVLFGYHAMAVPPTFLGLEGSFLLETGAETAMDMDLFLNLFERPHGLVCSLDYSADVFDASTVAGLLRSYEALLKAVAANPDERLSALPLVTRDRDDEERIRAWNATARLAPRDVCIHELIEHHADRSPDAPAVTLAREGLTYRELDRRANQLAHHLRSLGVKPDDRVGVCMTRSLEMVVAVVGILKAGGAYLPLDPEDPGEHLASIVAEARPTLILTQRAIHDALPDAGVPGVCLDPSWELIAKEQEGRPSPTASREHAANVLYVSGPGGRPVGVVSTHGGLVEQLDGMRESYPVREAESVLQHAALSSHVSLWEMLWPLSSGARLVLAPPPEARSLDAVASGRPVGIAIAATFTAEPLEESLAFWSRELKQPFRVQFAGHGQVFQELLDPSGLLSRNEDGVNVVLVRFDDWIEAGGGGDLERNVDDFVRALSAAAGRSSTPQIVVLCPASPAAQADPARAVQLQRMEQHLQSALAAVPSAHLVTPAEIERRYPVAERHDATSDELGRVPYTPAYFAALGTTIARNVHALRQQAETATPGALHAAQIAKLLVDERITTAFLSPDVLDEMCRDGELARCKSLQRVLTSAELMPPELPKRFFEHAAAELHAYYGSAEVGLAAASAYDPSRSSQPSLGRPAPGRQIHVLDAQKRPVPIGAVGEVYVGGSGLAREYLGAPELTASRFSSAPNGDAAAGRAYRTGDFARYRSDGTLEYRGRRDERVAGHGFHVEAAELEAALAAHAAVDDVAVVARADESGRRRHVAYVALTAGARAAAGDLHRFLAARLPSHALPSAVVILPALPRTADGALDRRRLPGTADAATAGKPFVAPRDELEARMVAIWQELLGARRIGVHHAFFDVGGQSQLAVSLLSRLKREFGVEIPLSVILDGGTVEDLCGILRRRRRSSSSVLVPLTTSGSRPPLFLAHSTIASPVSYVALSKELGPDQPIYGFQARDFNSNAEPLESVAAMAEVYLVELRRTQPRGPYRLAGHSAGGVLALEMAQRLRAQGETVELLAFMDTLHPARAGKEVDDATVALDVLGLDPPPAWRTLSLAARLRWAVTQQLDSAKSGGMRSPLAGLDPTARLRIVRVIAIQYRAWLGYTPRTYDGKVVLLRAKVRLPPSPLIRSFDEVQAEWVDILPNLEVRDVAGDHHTMLEAPHVADLARTMGPMLGARSTTRDSAPAAKTSALSSNGRIA